MTVIKYLQHRFALSEKGAKDMIAATLACALKNICLMFPAGLLFFFVDDMLNGTLTGRTLFYVTGILVCLVLIFLTQYMEYNTCFFSTYKESGVRRVSLAEQLRKLPLSYFGRKDLSDLTSTIMADCCTLETAQSHWIPELYGSIISTFLIAVSLLSFDWKMAAAALWVLVIAYAVVFSSKRVLGRFAKKSNRAKMICADGIQECLETVRDLKANNAEAIYLERLDTKIDDVEHAAKKSEIVCAVFVVSASMILKVGIASTALVGGMLLSTGQLSVSVFFMFLLVVSRLYDPMQAALQNLAAVISTGVPCGRMNEILEHSVQEGAKKLDNSGYDVEFSHVGFSYNSSTPVLTDVSFVARQGEVTALIGPSGEGKTTVSRLAARFWDVDKGKITVGGADISKIEPETLLSLYSIVFQEVTLFNNTILENIRIGRKDATDEEVIAAACLANCDEFAERLPQQWNTLIGENGSELSGGERQRISIARAFLKNAPIILLDEATASLDVDNETLIQDALARLIKDKTVIVIAHRMRTVAGADKIVVIKNGKATEHGSPKELLAYRDSYFCKMLHLQASSEGWSL
ncbi:MAG: ABC transporter ATP-binding protein [Prevotella sp.]